MRVRHKRVFDEDNFVVDMSWTSDDWLEETNLDSIDVESIRMKLDYILSYVTFVLKKVTSKYQNIADELGVKVNVNIFHNIVKIAEKIINGGEKPDDWVKIYLTTDYDYDSDLVLTIKLTKEGEYWEIFNYKLKEVFNSLNDDCIVLTPGGSAFKE